MKLFTKKTDDKNNEYACNTSVERRLRDDVFKYKNGFEAQKNKLYERIKSKSAKKHG